ncbi:MAG: energy transducer TonB [Cyclobacteriaceae bacterium]|nr:energy transducer TonB [Cyclobacteriaceae bacterium]
MKHKINILKTRPVATDNEIRRYMDFNSVALKYQTQMSMIHFWKLGLNVLVGAAIVSAGVYSLLPDATAPSPSTTSPEPAVVTVTDSATIEQLVTEEPVKQLTTATKAAMATPAHPQPTQVAMQEESEGQEQLPEAAYPVTEAEPVEGYPHLYDYFNAELRYPVEAIPDSIQGTQTVSFVIDRQGKIINIHINASLGPLFDKEAVRLIEHMPAWKPATRNGMPVPTRISLPLTFRLTKGTPDKQE